MKWTIVLLLFILLIVPTEIEQVEAQGQSTFTRNPIPYWTGNFKAEYMDNNYVRLLPKSFNLTVYKQAINSQLIIGTLGSDYTRSFASDNIYYSCSSELSGSYYFCYYGVVIQAPDNYTRFKFSIEARVSSLTGIYLKDAYYYNYTYGGRMHVSFVEMSTIDVLKSWTIEDPQMKCVTPEGYLYFGIKVAWTVSWALALIDYLVVEFDSEKGDYSQSTINIPLIENQERYTLQTMIQRVNNNDTIMLRLNTSMGIFNSLKYTINSSDIIRLTWEVKNSINVYRLTVADENNKVIQRIQYPYAPSKYFINIFLNYTLHQGELRLYYLTGELDYTNVREFELVEEDNDWPDDWMSTSFFCRIQKDESYTNTVSAYRIYECQMDNFQYLRTLFEWNMYSSDVFCWLDMTGSVLIQIDDYTIKFSIYTYAGIGYDTASSVIIKHNGNTIFELWTENGPTTSTGRCALKVWRTLDNQIGIGFSSESNLFRYSSDTRRSVEDFTYYYLTTVSRFDAIVQTDWEASAVYEEGTPQAGWIEMTLGGMEYSYLADNGVAEPHFSTTWWMGIIPGIFSVIQTVAAPVAMAVEAIGENFDIVAAILAPLEEIIVNALAGLTNIIVAPLVNVIEDVINNVLTALAGLADVFVSVFLTALADFIGDGLDILIALQLAILAIVVNSIGALFGIADLWTALVTLGAGFVSSITGFTEFMSALFGYIITFFTTFVNYAITYAPLAFQIFIMLFIINVMTALAQHDLDRLARQMSSILNAFYRVLSFLFSLIETVISAIASLVPL